MTLVYWPVSHTKSHRSINMQRCSPYSWHGVHQTKGWKQPMGLKSVRQRNRSTDTAPNTNLCLREVSNAMIDTAFE